MISVITKSTEDVFCLDLKSWNQLRKLRYSKQAVLKDGGGSVVKVIVHFIPIFQISN